MKSQFTKKVVVYIPYIEKYLKAYCVEQLAFPFCIVKYHNMWHIVNRFSGNSIGVSFFKKREAETFFNIFATCCDIRDIEFKDPNSDFNYIQLIKETFRKIDYAKYRKNNFEM